MFIQETDYKTLITDDDREVVDQSDDEMRKLAENTAIEIMSGYLRSRYDVSLCFDGAVPENRNKALVMFCLDITLYNLHSSIPGRFVPETREKRRDDAIKWLEGVSSGKIDPGLPAKNDTTGSPVTQIIYGSNEKQSQQW